MDDTKQKEFEKVCKNYKVSARMIAARMVLILDTTGTIAVYCAAEGCKPTQVCPDCVASLGSAVPERPSCIVPAVARYRFGSPARRQAERFCDVV